MRAAAMRILLIREGVCSEDEFDALNARIQAVFDADLQAMLAKGLEAASAEEIRRLLEKTTGTKH